MTTYSCSPSYSYRPEFKAGPPICTAPVYQEHRSRLHILKIPYLPMPPNGLLHGLFFRSKDQSYTVNNISLEMTSSDLNVYFFGQLVEQYPTSGGISSLRSRISGTSSTPYDVPSNYIEMPTFLFDIYDIVRTIEDTTSFGGLFTFPVTKMIGGSGGPTDGSGLAGIRTGPDRSLIVIATTENLTGQPVTPPAEKRVRQWQGANWISYSNLIPRACPIEGT